MSKGYTPDGKKEPLPLWKLFHRNTVLRPTPVNGCKCTQAKGELSIVNSAKSSRKFARREALPGATQGKPQKIEGDDCLTKAQVAANS